MTAHDSTRRELLKRVAAYGLSAVAVARRGASAQGPGVRKDVATLDPKGPELTAYRAAIVAMRKRPASNARSWEAQARIHLNHCPHGNWFFLPWHRAYLHFFEQVCREAASDEAFMLPYWNWTKSPRLPAPFAITGDELFDPTRTIDGDDVAEAEFVGADAIDAIMGISDFQTFASAKATCPGSGPIQRRSCGSGELEATPHNYVHGFVGGNMGAFLSPRDPLFWLHHANIDRIWAEWNATHANTSDPDWLNFSFTGNFVDGTGAKQNIAVKSTLDTAALGYRYDTLPEPPPVTTGGGGTPQESVSADASLEGPAPSSGAVTVTLRPTPKLRELLRQASIAEGPKAPTVRVTLEGVKPPADRRAVRVFMNAPDPSRATPAGAPYHVATITFFEHGEGPEHPRGERTFLLDASATIGRLQRTPEFSFDAPLRVQLVTVATGPEPETPGGAAPLVPRRVTLSIIR